MTSRQTLDQLLKTGDRATVSASVNTMIEGFSAFVDLVEKTRTAQKGFFANKIAGNLIEANKQLSESKRLEKEVDKAVKTWADLLNAPSEGEQTSLFQ